MAGPKHSELPAVVVPQHLWLRSARPAQGKIVLWAVPAALILAGLVMPGTAVRVGLVLAGIGAFLALPAMMLGRLDALAREVEAADRNKAAELLRSLPERPIVKLFAPLGWRSLQLALLHLKVGDGHAAAAGFAETARLCLQPDAVMLVSAEAHALVVAGERMKARDLLQKLADAKLLGPRDQLDLGIVLVLESKKFKQALSYIEAARKSIGDHPLVVVAHALALQKVERIDEASELLEKVQIAIKDEQVDPLTEDLLKRARKGAQDFLEGQLRRERRARSRRTTIVVSSEAAASEIVSGEIGAGAEPTATEAHESAEPRRFNPVEAPEPEPEPVKPKRPAAREPDAPKPGLEIDLYSVPHPSAMAPRPEPAKQPAKKEEPRGDSLAAALSNVALPVGEAPLPEAPKVESDVPVFRRRQTLMGTLPTESLKEPSRAPEPVASRQAEPIKPAESKAAATEPNKPPAPALPSLNTLSTGAPATAPPLLRSGLPTRAPRQEVSPLPVAGAGPTFRAPTKSDKGDE